MKRRDFFKNIAGASGVWLAAPAILATLHAVTAGAEGGRRKKPGGSGVEMVDPKDSMAVAVGYITDATKNKKAAGNNCANCSIYKATGTENGKGVGTCPLFGKKLVLGEGYCNSWAKKV